MFFVLLQPEVIEMRFHKYDGKSAITEAPRVTETPEAPRYAVYQPRTAVVGVRVGVAARTAATVLDPVSKLKTAKAHLTNFWDGVVSGYTHKG